MIRQTISELETRIRQSEQIDEPRREELLELIRQAREELEQLPEARREELSARVHLQNAVDQQEITSEQAEQDIAEIRRASNDFSDAVLRFETSHPRLTDLANRIAIMLSGVGI